MRRDQLAASQAREAALREALELASQELNFHHPADKIMQKALALPNDTTALIRSNKLYAAGVLRELCKFAFTHQCNFDLWLLDKAEQLRKEAGE
jgi:hypothetical protein